MERTFDHEQINISQRDLSLDFLKGVLIYFVILGHIIAKYGSLVWTYTIIHTFHMPLFFFISGYLMVPSMRTDFHSFAKKKFARILRPALLWSLLFFLLKSPSSLDWGTKIIKSFMDIWFLYVLFYLYIITWPMAKSRWKYLWFATAVLIGYILYPFLLKVPSKHFGYIVEEFRIIRELPLFLMGLLYWEVKDRLKRWHILTIIVLSTIIYYFCFYHTLILKGENVGYLLSHENYILRAFVYQSGTVLAFVLFKGIWKTLNSTYIAHAIAFTGQNTLGIYALNGLFIFTVPAIIGVDYRFSLPLWFYAALMTAFLLGVTLTIKKIPKLRQYLLGEQ